VPSPVEMATGGGVFNNSAGTVNIINSTIDSQLGNRRLLAGRRHWRDCQWRCYLQPCPGDGEHNQQHNLRQFGCRLALVNGHQRLA
jgi:hypothetical protein